MSIERARAWLAARGVDPARILEFPVSSATVELAAKALNCAPERIAKSLALRLLGAAGDGVLLVVAAGDARLDNAKYKARFGCKPKMLGHEEAAEEVGHAVGGVCPFGVNPGVEVWLDESLRRFETVVRPIPQFDPANPKMISQGPSVCVFSKENTQEVLAAIKLSF